MIIASKIDEEYPLRIEMFASLEPLTFTVDQIKEEERLILTVIEYNLEFPTTLDIIERLLGEFTGEYENEFSLKEKILLTRAKNLSVYLAFMAGHEYTMLKHKYKHRK